MIRYIGMKHDQIFHRLIFDQMRFSRVRMMNCENLPYFFKDVQNYIINCNVNCDFSLRCAEYRVDLKLD